MICPSQSAPDACAFSSLDPANHVPVGMADSEEVDEQDQGAKCTLPTDCNMNLGMLTVRHAALQCINSRAISHTPLFLYLILFLWGGNLVDRN